MRVHLVRHGQTAWNAERRYQGHTDIPLDAEGIKQANRLAAAFDHEPLSRILTSDLQRAQMTAAPLAARHSIPTEARADLRERSIGEWEAHPMEWVAERFIELEQSTRLSREHARPPGGQSMKDTWDLLEPIVADIEAFHAPQLVVIHGGSGGLLLARLLRGTEYTARSFRFDNGSITTIARRPDGGYQLIRYNDTAHLAIPSPAAH